MYCQAGLLGQMGNSGQFLNTEELLNLYYNITLIVHAINEGTDLWPLFLNLLLTPLFPHLMVLNLSQPKAINKMQSFKHPKIIIYET